jgi:glutamate--cysteine ligase
MEAEKRTDFLDRDQLRRYFEQGCKPSSEWGIGSEYENFLVDLDLEKPVSYAGPKSISKVFDLLMNNFEWVPVFEKSNIIGLQKDKANISLEPGGQFELSGAIKKTVHEVEQEMTSFIQNMKVICEELGLGLFSMGATPFWKRDEMPIMPKNRYKKIMMPYMKKVGTQGLDMMFRTCTIQVNLDYSSEADMAKKLRVAACIQPLVTALFASSPIFDGHNTGYQSWRAQVWKNTDKDRTGIPKFIFDNELNFDSWIEYALDVPMYFIRRRGTYVNLSGSSFREFIKGQLKTMPNQRATYSDWIDHLTTIFTDVRLKNFIEMRGADGGPSKNVTALAALWVGLLYDNESLDNVFNLVKPFNWQSINKLNIDVCKLGMHATINDKALWILAEEILDIARSGLRNRALAHGGEDEGSFLIPLIEQISKKRTLASQLSFQFDSKWKNKPSKFYYDFNFLQGLRK